MKHMKVFCFLAICACCVMIYLKNRDFRKQVEVYETKIEQSYKQQKAINAEIDSLKNIIYENQRTIDSNQRIIDRKMKELGLK